MKELNPADNYPQAEVIAFNHVRKELTDRKGHVIFPVDHRMNVLINHTGKVPTHSPNGWKFTFHRESLEDEWKLESVDEY